MSERNVETVKAIYREWEQGDFSATGWADPEIEYSIPEPSGKVHRGVSEMGRAWLDWAGEWDDLRISLTEIRDLGERVLTVHSFHGKGRASGVPVDSLPGAGIWTFRDGKVVRYQGYTEVEAAFEQAGISEDG